MNRSARTIHIADPLWQALEAMSRQMAVDPDALVNQAIFALARSHGFVVPKAVALEEEKPAQVRPAAEAVPLPSPPSAVVAPAPMASALIPSASPAREPGESSVAAFRARAAERVRAIVQDVEAFVEPQPDPPPAQQEGDQEEDSADEADEEHEEQAGHEEKEAGQDSEADEPSEEPEALEEVGDESDTVEGIEPHTAEEGVPDEAGESEPPLVHPVLQKPPASLQNANPFASDRTIVQPPRARLFLQVREHEPIEVVAERFLIGRGNHCNLIIDSVRVSREHAVLLSEGEGFVLEDLGSSNGTWLGTRRLQRHVISDGDVLMLGNEKVRFSVEPAGAQRAS
jgi:hypothetical protein